MSDCLVIYAFLLSPEELRSAECDLIGMLQSESLSVQLRDSDDRGSILMTGRLGKLNSKLVEGLLRE